MATASIPVISREYVWVEVTASGDDADLLTTLPVKFAFLEDETAEPADADWKDGSWSTTASTPTAQCLVGPGGTVELPAATYNVWVLVDGATERPIRRTGLLAIV
jgi:hypothetical protein